MKSKTIGLILVMMSALIWTTFNGSPVISVSPVPPVVPYPSGPFEKFGPRVDRLTFVVSGTVEREMDDFKSGMFDIFEWAAPAPEWDDWLTDPEITMGLFSEMSCEYLAFNNARWPLGHSDMLAEGWDNFPVGWQGDHNASLWKRDELWDGPGCPSGAYPGGTGTADWCYVDYNCSRCMSARQFRRGLAHLYDRDDQMDYMQGAGENLEPSLFWPPLKTFWENPSAPTYPFSLKLASDAFVKGGFKDWDGDTVMEYSPSNGSIADDYEELPSIKFYTRIDDDDRSHAAKVMSFYMGPAGLGSDPVLYPCGSIPHSLIIATRAQVDTDCWAYYDYDIYTEYWDWGPTPDFYAEWFASFGDIYPEIYAYNFHRYHNLEFDQLSDALLEAPNLAAAKVACDQMQMILHSDCASVPQFHYIGYQARRTEYGTWPGEEKYADRNWTNTNCYEGEGWFSWWNILNSQVEGFDKGGTLRHGMNGDADNLDIIDSWYTYDALVMNNIYDSLIVPDPHDVSNISKYIPWLCQSYEIGTWEHPTEGTCTAMNFTLIPGTLWQDGTPMTADDVGFSFWFHREARSVTYGVTKDFEEYVTYDTDPGRPGNETVEIRFKRFTWLAPVYVWGTPIIPKHIWSEEAGGPGPDGSAAFIPEAHDALIGTGPFRFYKDGVVGRVDRVPGEYVYLEANPLYFRKYVEPDVGDVGDPENPAAKDGLVSLFDFLVVALPDHIFAREDDNGQWGTPPGAWGEPCDVNKDGKIGVGDLMEIGVHFAESWPPVWYEW